MKSILFILLLTSKLLATTSQAPLDEAKTHLKTYCYDCHNAEKKKGKLNLTSLNFLDLSHENLLTWQEVVDQLHHEEMPPEDELMPKDEERTKIVQTLQSWIDANQPKPAQTVLRRLNRKEYENTIRDLFKIRMEDFHATEAFPADERKHHFTNNGEKLVTSSFLLNHYMNAANAVIERVLPKEKKQPRAQQAIYRPPFQKSNRDLSSWYYGKDQYQDLVVNETSLRTIYLSVDEFSEGVPERGIYHFKLNVEAKNAKSSQRGQDRFENPHSLGKNNLSVTIYAGSSIDGGLNKAVYSDKFIGEFTLPNDQIHTLEFSAWLEKGQSLKFGFPQGLDSVKKARFVLKKPDNKRPDFLKGVDPDQFTNKGKILSGSEWAAYIQEHAKHYPTLRFYQLEVDGPHYKQWPHQAVTHLKGNKSYAELDLRKTIHNLATKAFRRPVTETDLSAIHKYVNQTYQQSKNKREALANGIRAILCSPQFFYHYENEGALDNYALASRLSYFLWSSMPDCELFELAKLGKLSEEKVLLAQVERMIHDPKTEELTKKLADQWLGLYQLGNMPPDVKEEVNYYRYKLKHHSKFETYKLLEYILKNNQPYMDILTADYTFLNKGLAHFYGLKNAENYPSHDYIKSPSPDSYRQGILGHMGLLTATANGVDTSPIIRGIWVYETILGKAAPEPPDSVPAVEPDIRNAKTIRDQLIKHRESQDCMICHQKFDHFGFALENFDHLGRWRNEYKEEIGKKKGKSIYKTLPIESFGEMVTGEKFKDINGLREIISSKSDLFAKTIISKLLTLAIGREPNAFDRKDIEKVLAESQEKGNGFKDLLLAVVNSNTFKTK